MAWDFKRNKMRETPSSAVAYASRFWMFHILESQMNWQGQLSSSDMGEHNIEIILKLKDFLDRGRILSWIEILMCIDIADEAPVQLRKLKTWLETVSLVPVRKRTSTRQSSAQQSGRSWLFSSPQTVTPDDESGPHRDPVHVQNCYAEVKRKVDGLLAYLETQEFRDDDLLRRNAARKVDANEMRETPQASVRLDAIIGDNKQTPRARKLAEDLFLELGMGGETQV
ncbi:hypothetical protein K435DRAFT_968993 [Dendrothele bispora CBS 962.96]|uniref:Uncharacterized protein n=1 Tax=Dendrothele bispora (strain CBS 962.96) TaxID=1314807 RepID=A0A4S8LKX9_DENBC|nr:hypothetical protein K435DRAFT_968993 [Dendrothele bispora CBS 962.96]